MKRDRSVQKGPDYQKIAKIYSALKQHGDWIHISGLAKMTGINQVTVRYYLDKYMKKFIEETKISPTIKLRMVRLKPNVELKDITNRLEILDSIHGREPTIQEAFTKQ